MPTSLRLLEQWHHRLCQGRATDGRRLDTVQARGAWLGPGPELGVGLGLGLELGLGLGLGLGLARRAREEVAADARAARGVEQVRRRQPTALCRLRMVPREDGSVRHARRCCRLAAWLGLGLGLGLVSRSGLGSGSGLGLGSGSGLRLGLG